jgi:DNA modification methylase
MSKNPKIIMRKVADLVPSARNARTHSEAQVQKIAASIKEFGFINPIITGKNSDLVAGHGRLMAAKLLGLSEVPTIPAEHLTEKQKRAYMLADNRIAELAGWDMDILKIELGEVGKDFKLDDLGFDDAFLTGGHVKGLVDEDETPDPPVAPLSKPGDIWLLGEHRVMCGDSTDQGAVVALMAGEKADMVFTDPPYGVSYADKNKYLNSISSGNRIQKNIENDHMTLSETSDFIYKSFCSIKLILAKRSSYYITAPQGGDLLMTMMMMMQKAELPLRHCLIWVKNNHVLGRTDYNYKHEPILYGWDNVHDFYGEGEHRFSTWEIPKPQKNDLHPTMKPVALIENALLNSTKPGQIVVDIFGGSGSTLIAAQKTGRCARLMELDPQYADVIVKRWQDFTGLKATLSDTGKTFNG